MRKEEQSHKLIKVVFRLLNGIQMRGKGSRWLQTACKVSHALSILTYLDLNAQQMFVGLQSQDALWSIIRVSLAVFSMIAVIGMGVVLAVEYRFYNEMGTLQQHKAILKVNVVATSIIYYTVEFVYFFGCILFFESLQMLSALTIQDYILLIFGSILFVVQSLLVLSTRLFGRAALFVGPIVALTGPVLGVVLLFLLAGILIYKEGSSGNRDHQLQRILYFLIAFTCLWSFLQFQYTVIKQNVVAFLNLIFISISALGIYFFYPSLFVRQSTLDDNQQLLRWFNQRSSGQNQNEDQINLLQEQLYEKYFQETEMFKSICYSNQNIRQISIAVWKDNQKAKALCQRIKWTRQNDNSFQMNLFYFRAGFSLKIKATTLLKQLSAFLDKNRNLSLQQKYQIYKLNQQIFKYYQQAGSANDSAIQIADVVEAQRHYDQFYQQLDRLLIELLQYWKQVVSNDFSINENIESKIGAISKLQQNAQKSLKRLSSYRVAEEERLFSMVSELINCYRSGGSEVSGGIKGEKIGSFQYLILEGDSVSKISLRLLKSLGYEPDSSQVHSMRSLLPVNFFGYLQEVERRFLAREQMHQFAIPVVQSSGCIVLKQCLLYLVPHQICAFQYLISFQGGQVPNQIFILYNANKQNIEHFSQGFRDFIGMKLDSFQEFLTGENILFSCDVFQTELAFTELQTLRAHQIIKTKIVYPDFYLRRNSLYNFNDEVILHLEHQFSFGSQNYILLNVQSQSYRQSKIQAQQKSQSNIRSLNRQKQLHQQYSHEEFFCPVENPYKSKIIQKLNGIRSRNYKSYFFQILGVKLAMLLIILVNPIVFNVVSQMMTNNGYTIANVMFNINNQYIYLLRLFSGTYSNFLFANDPVSSAKYFNQTFFKGKASSADLVSAASKLTAYYQDLNDKNSQALMSTYLLYKPGVASHFQMDYLLEFSEFNITTNTMLTSFYDFIVEVEQGFSDGSAVTFLSQNYDSIMGIMPVYQQVDAFFNDYLTQYQMLKILGYVFIIALTITIILSFCSTAKMIDIHQQMYLLYKFVDWNDICKILKELTIIQDAIGTILDEQNMHKTFDQVIITRKSLIDSRRDIPESNHELSKRNAGDNGLSDKKIEKEQQTFFKPIYNTFKYIYFCPILFATAWLIVYLEYNNMQSDQQDFHEAINLLQKLQSDQMHIEKFYNDLFQPRFYQLNFGPYKPSIMHSVLKNQFYSEGLPSVFAKDFFYDQNLCQTQYLSSINIPFFTRNLTDCNQMELGILTDGYSGALQFYQTYIRDQAKLIFSDYLGVSNSNKLREIIFLKELIFSYLRMKKANFMNNYSIHNSNSSSADINVLIFTLISCLCLIILLSYNAITLRKKMHVVIDLICGIPSSAMYKITMTNYIRKEGILSKMDKL